MAEFITELGNNQNINTNQGGQIVTGAWVRSSSIGVGEGTKMTWQE